MKFYVTAANIVLLNEELKIKGNDLNAKDLTEYMIKLHIKHEKRYLKKNAEPRLFTLRCRLAALDWVRVSWEVYTDKGFFKKFEDNRERYAFKFLKACYEALKATQHEHDR